MVIRDVITTRRMSARASLGWVLRNSLRLALNPNENEGRYSIGKTSYARSATSDRVETRSLCSMVFIWSPDTPEIHPKFHGGISKNLRILFIPSSVIPRSRLLDTRRWLDVLLTPKHVSAIRHVEAIKYSAVFLAELPNGLQIAGLHSGTAGRPNGRSAINRCTANKEVICQSSATPSNRTQCLRL